MVSVAFKNQLLLIMDFLSFILMDAIDEEPVIAGVREWKVCIQVICVKYMTQPRFQGGRKKRHPENEPADGELKSVENSFNVERNPGIVQREEISSNVSPDWS